MCPQLLLLFLPLGIAAQLAQWRMELCHCNMSQPWLSPLFLWIYIYMYMHVYIYIYIWCIYSIFWVQKSFWNRCHILTSSNVVKTKTNHPWKHNFHGRYKPFPVMGALWHCFTHISSNRSVNNQHNPRPPTAAVDRGERGAALARGQGISGSHDDEAKRRSHGPLGWDIMGLGLVIKRCPIGCFFVMIFGWKGDESWCKWGVSMLHEIWFGSSMGWNGLWMALAIFGDVSV